MLINIICDESLVACNLHPVLLGSVNTERYIWRVL